MKNFLNFLSNGTGFGSYNLVVLETHVVYSVCNLKSAAHFFIMQCSQSFSIKNQVPLKLLVERLVHFAIVLLYDIVSPGLCVK